MRAVSALRSADELRSTLNAFTGYFLAQGRQLPTSIPANIAISFLIHLIIITNYHFVDQY